MSAAPAWEQELKMTSPFPSQGQDFAHGQSYREGSRRFSSDTSAPAHRFFPVLPLMGDCIYAVTQGGIAVCINQSVLIGGKKIFGDADVSETALFIGVAVFCA